MNLFEEELPDDRIPEIIEPEIIDVAPTKENAGPKQPNEEMFDKQ